MEAPTVASLTSVAGASALVAIIMEVALRAIRPSGELVDRFGPLASILVGIVVVGAATFVTSVPTGEGILQMILTGAFAGLAASGIHDVVSGTGQAIRPTAPDGEQNG